MMKPWMIPGLLGFLAGGVLVFAVQSSRGTAASTQAAGRIAELEQALAQTKQKAASQTAKLESLRQISTSLPAPELKPAEPVPETAPSPTPDREAQRRAFMERMAERTIERWATKLKLTPEQIARLKQMATARLQDPNLDPRAWGNIEADLLNVLTPQQKAAYEQTKNRESQARQELRVNTELSRVQSLFDLTETQKDQIFQKFAAIEIAASSEPATPGDANAQMNARDERNQKRVDALADILTPEQLQEYADSLNNNSFRGLRQR
jgi:hypothetical protein